MAYTPKTWVCGETITDVGLNNIEEGIQEALQGGGSSLPEVTTADDGKVLTVVDGEWDKADKDFKCSSDTIFNGSVTTSGSGTHTASFTLAKAIVADSVVVTFNGTKYECRVKEEPGTGSTILQVMGGNSTESFPGYPFRISVVKGATSATIYTAANGTYTLNITKASAEISDCFKTAVKSVVDTGYNCVGDDVETTECFEKAVESLLGYECENTELLTETATVPADGYVMLSYNVPLTQDVLYITFDGVEYKCPVQIETSPMGQIYNYGGFTEGGPDYSKYPFVLVSLPGSNPGVASNNLYAQTAGEHTIKVTVKSISTTSCFEEAVKSVVDAGFECVDDDIFNGSLTTTTAGSKQAQIPYSEVINAPTIKVTFNGVEYELTLDEEVEQGYKYSSDTAPFKIVSDISAEPPYNYIKTNRAGTFNVKITIPKGKAITTECFEKAVKEVVGESGPLILKYAGSLEYNNYDYLFYDKTWQEVRDAFLNGRPIYMYNGEEEIYVSLSSYCYDGEEDVTADFALFDNPVPPRVKSLTHIVTFHLGSGMPSDFTAYNNHMAIITYAG